MPETIKLIDKAVQEREARKPKRGHLGASQIGARCARQSWYGFRWAYHEKHTGRLLRLFQRGHEEEFRFVEYLRLAGAEVRDYSQRLCWNADRGCYSLVDWDEPLPRDWYYDVSDQRGHIEVATADGQGPKQYGFSDNFGTGGHAYFSGSTDGMISWPGVLPDGWGLQEFKTHSDKSFNDLTKKGVLSSKPVHYAQMQIYMHYLGLPWAYYLAVNKNDDNLYDEVIYYKREVAEYHIDRARQIVAAKAAPLRITEDASWFECRFCAFREICHYGDTPQKNCRSCVYAEPGATGWHCTKYHSDLPADFIPKGCHDWTPIQ